MKLVNYHPFGVAFNQLFNEFDNNSFRHAKKSPSVNISEDDHAYIIELAAPGLEKSDFSIKVKDGHLTIEAQKEETKTEADKPNYRRREFSFESFSRRFHLPENVDANAIEAKYDQGILWVEIPKQVVEEKIKQIEIS